LVYRSDFSIDATRFDQSFGSEAAGRVATAAYRDINDYLRFTIDGYCASKCEGCATSTLPMVGMRPMMPWSEAGDHHGGMG
jgi:hypothetical protein